MSASSYMNAASRLAAASAVTSASLSAFSSMRAIILASASLSAGLSKFVLFIIEKDLIQCPGEPLLSELYGVLKYQLALICVRSLVTGPHIPGSYVR